MLVISNRGRRREERECKEMIHEVNDWQRIMYFAASRFIVKNNDREITDANERKEVRLPC